MLANSPMANGWFRRTMTSPPTSQSSAASSMISPPQDPAPCHAKSRRLARLEFKDTTIALLDSTGQALWTLTLGKDAEGGGRFVRFGDEKKGYVANLGLFIDSTAKNWADSLLVDLKPDDISGVEITFDYAAPVTATREKKEGAWVATAAPAGQRIKGDRIISLLSSFTSLRFEDTAELTDANVEAARKHSRTVKLTTFDHKTINVDLGRKPEQKIVKPAETAKTASKPAPAADAGPKPLELATATSTADNAGPKGETAAGTSIAARRLGGGQAGGTQDRDHSRRSRLRVHHQLRSGCTHQRAHEEAGVPDLRLEFHEPAPEARRILRAAATLPPAEKEARCQASADQSRSSRTGQNRSNPASEAVSQARPAFAQGYGMAGAKRRLSRMRLRYGYSGRPGGMSERRHRSGYGASGARRRRRKDCRRLPLTALRLSPIA